MDRCTIAVDKRIQIRLITPGQPYFRSEIYTRTYRSTTPSKTTTMDYTDGRAGVNALSRPIWHHTLTQASAHTRANITHTHTYTHLHTPTHTYTPTHTHTRAHTHTHTHTQEHTHRHRHTLHWYSQ